MQLTATRVLHYWNNKITTGIKNYVSGTLLCLIRLDLDFFWSKSKLLGQFSLSPCTRCAEVRKTHSVLEAGGNHTVERGIKKKSNFWIFIQVWITGINTKCTTCGKSSELWNSGEETHLETVIRRQLVCLVLHNFIFFAIPCFCFKYIRSRAASHALSAWFTQALHRNVRNNRRRPFGTFALMNTRRRAFLAECAIHWEE